MLLDAVFDVVGTVESSVLGSCALLGCGRLTVSATREPQR